MKNTPLRLLALAAAAALALSACMPRAQSLAAREPEIQTIATPAPSPTPAPTPGQGLGGWTFERTPEQQKYGSAGLLAWPCVLYSLYLDEPEGGAAWSEEDIARSQQNLALAVDWITEQAAGYGARARLYYGSDDLVAHLRYSAPFAGGEAADEGQTFYADMDKLCARLDTAELAETYGTTNIGFLVFLPVAGCSFTMVHYLEDGSSFYYEYSCLYKDNVFFPAGTFEMPAVYAHEILHLFGAPDLYEGSGDLYVTPELIDYVTANWPDAIMYDTYNAAITPEYDSIPKSLCPLTAFRLGLCAGFPGAEQFPAHRHHPARLRLGVAHRRTPARAHLRTMAACLCAGRHGGGDDRRPPAPPARRARAVPPAFRKLHDAGGGRCPARSPARRI